MTTASWSQGPYYLHDPARGDIIVFEDPHPGQQPTAERVRRRSSTGCSRDRVPAARQRGLHQAGDRPARRHRRGQERRTSTSTASSSSEPYLTAERRGLRRAEDRARGTCLRAWATTASNSRTPASGSACARSRSAGDRLHPARGHHRQGLGRGLADEQLVTTSSATSERARADRPLLGHEEPGERPRRSPRSRTRPATQVVGGGSSAKNACVTGRTNASTEHRAHRPHERQAPPVERRGDDREHQQPHPGQHHHCGGLRLSSRDTGLVPREA